MPIIDDSIDIEILNNTSDLKQDEVLPKEEPSPTNVGTLDLIEYILKQPDALHRLIHDPKRQAKLIPQFLGISLVGFVFFGVAMSLVFAAAGSWPELKQIVAWLDSPRKALLVFLPITSGLFGPWLDGSAACLIAAYSLGLIAASGICLPSLYFYGLLAGVRMSMMDVVLHTLKSKATAAVALVGILPIYATLALSTVIFEMPPAFVHLVFFLGLCLPFIAGLWGTRSLYRGLANLCHTMPAQRRASRECFLRRLVLSWSAIYTAITPVMIYTLWEAMTRS